MGETGDGCELRGQRHGAIDRQPPGALDRTVFVVAAVFPMHKQPLLRERLPSSQQSRIHKAVAEAIETHGDDASVDAIVAELVVGPISLGARHYDEKPWARRMVAAADDYSAVRQGIYPGQAYTHSYVVYRIEVLSGAGMVSCGANGGPFIDPDFVLLDGSYIVVRAANDRHRDEQISWIEEHVRRANAVIEDWNANGLPEIVQREIDRQMRARQAADHRTAGIEAAGFTPTPRSSPLRLPLPDRTHRTSTRTTSPRNSPVGVPFALEQDQFAAILDCIATHREQVERHPGAGASPEAPEEDHRDRLLGALNMRFRDATGESFSKKGKTDVRVVVDDHAYFHAECKIWAGVSSLDEALEQLTEQYLTYRDRFGALVMFVRGIKHPEELLPKAIGHLVANGGDRLDDIAGFPVVRTRAAGGPVHELAVVMLVVDSAPPRR